MHANADNTAITRRPYQRVLVKLSGEAMAGGTADSRGMGITAGELRRTASELIEAADSSGAQIVVVPGGGNIVRGAQLAQAGLISRDAADRMGMLGTIVNAVALAEALTNLGRRARVFSAMPVHPFAPALEPSAALDALDAGEIVIAAAGVGQPYFSTDSGAALRAAQLGCDALVKATKVDGVYDDDPATNPDATRFTTISVEDAIDRRLRVMDLSALTLCRDNAIDIAVCDFHTPGNLARLIAGEPVGTVITSG